MQHLQPNTTLQVGKYRIERVLGQGGFGITYLAEQVSLGRKVAIKEFFMKDYCGRDTIMVTAPSSGTGKLVEQYRKKFIKEARNLSRLNHPHIIKVLDVFEENGTVYYVMPYFSGGSLQDYVESHGTLSEDETMKYIRQIASALKYMHEDEHICHYDVKPANILLDDKGDAVLIDFGISKNYDAAGHETSTTPIGLSEGYAPIEQYQQNVEEFSPASDVYALGATLYFLLHGKHPVSAVRRASGTALLMNKQISQSIKDIINASMKISKSERAQTTDVFMCVFNIYSTQKKNSSYKLLIIVIISTAILGFIIWINHNTSLSQTLGVDPDTIEGSLNNKTQYILRGKVADNIAYTMWLSVNGNVVEGTEHYDNQKKDAIVHIKGTIDNHDIMTLNEYDGNAKTGTFIGLFCADSYSGTFTNIKGKEMDFNSVVMSEEAFEKWNSNQFETTLYSSRKKVYNINVEINADYPIKGNEDLVGKTRLFIAGAIEKMFQIDTKVSDLSNGQDLLNHSVAIRSEALSKDYGLPGNEEVWENTINIQKCFENEKCVSFCAKFRHYLGGVANEQCFGATFKKEDGKKIVVFKDSYNSDLDLLIAKMVKKELGDRFVDVNEEFGINPWPEELPYLTKQGVRFDYQHYEIGPGYLGQISIVIPYSNIKEYLTDEAKSLLDHF